MTDQRMDTLKSLAIDGLASIGLAAFFYTQRVFLLDFGISTLWIPVIAALAGAACGRLLDWTKDYIVSRYNKRKRKKPITRKSKNLSA